MKIKILQKRAKIRQKNVLGPLPGRILGASLAFGAHLWANVCKCLQKSGKILQKSTEFPEKPVKYAKFLQKLCRIAEIPEEIMLNPAKTCRHTGQPIRINPI